MYYVYGIEHDLRDYPLYIGMTDNPERRFRQHLELNVKLHKELEYLRNMGRDILSKWVDHPLVTWARPEIEPHLRIYAQTSSIQEARKLEPMLNTQHNEKGRAFHTSVQFIYDMDCVFENAGIPQEQANQIIRKLLVLIKKDGWSLKYMEFTGEE